VPRFYDVDGDGLPQRWIQMMRDTVAGLGPKVLASRMVRDYVTTLYAPAAASAHAVNETAGGARALAEWKQRVRAHWSGVVVDHVESLSGDAVEVGADIGVSALVRLGELTPEDVEVQLVSGLVDTDDNLNETSVVPFPTGVDVDGGLRRYEGTIEARRSGSIGYTVRVVPQHPELADVAEMGLATVPSELPAPPSAAQV
jgi:starch phosphorylase